MNDVYPSSLLHVERQGSGPRVIFVHGGEAAGGMIAFASQLPLAHAFTLILPDLPGHGQSPTQGSKQINRDADLIAGLLEDGAHLVGHSYGGKVALLAAAQHPQAVHSLTLIEPATLDIAQEDPDVRRLLGELGHALALADPRLRLEAFARAVGIRKTWPDPLPEAYRRLADDLPLLQRKDLPPSRRLAEQVATAGIPSLVISGGHQAAFEKICDVLSGMLGGERVVISGYGHAPQQSAEAMNICLEHFWSNSSRKGRAS